MATKFTARVRRGLAEIAALHVEHCEKHALRMNAVQQRDIILALMWIGEQTSTEGDGERAPGSAPDWWVKFFGDTPCPDSHKV